MTELPKLRIENKHFLNGRTLSFSVLIEPTGSMVIGKDNLKEIIHRCESMPNLLTDCEKLVSLLSSVPHRGDDKRWWQTLEKSKRDIAKAKTLV